MTTTVIDKTDVRMPVYQTAILNSKKRFLQVSDTDTFVKEAGFAFQAFKGNNSLQACTPDSIKDAIINIALTGATLNPVMKQASLIPRKIKGQYVCCLDFQYRGLIKMATQKGSCLDMDADVVHEKDEFRWQKGLNPILEHVPFLQGPRGSITHVYAIATLPNNIKKFLVMSREEVEQIRKMSMAPDSPMWKDFYGEACKKTAIKRLYKTLPQTEQVSQAIDVIDRAEGINFSENERKETKASKLENYFVEPEPCPREPLAENGQESTAIEGELEKGITVNQKKKINTIFTALKVSKRESRLKEISDILNREVQTIMDLTEQEADSVIKAIEILLPKGGAQNERNE